MKDASDPRSVEQVSLRHLHIPQRKLTRVGRDQGFEHSSFAKDPDLRRRDIYPHSVQSFQEGQELVRIVGGEDAADL